MMMMMIKMVLKGSGSGIGSICRQGSSISYPRKRPKSEAKLKPATSGNSSCWQLPVSGEEMGKRPFTLPCDVISGSAEKVPSILRSMGFPNALERIHGWEKDNRTLRELSKVFDRRGGAIRPIAALSAKKQDPDKDPEEPRLPTVPLVLESKRLVSEAIKLGHHPVKIVTSRLENLRDLPLDRVEDKANVQLILAPHKVVSGWSNLTTSPGLLVVFDRNEVIEKVTHRKHKQLQQQDEEEEGGIKSDYNLTVVVDNVRNPENLGGILRVAAAAGCHRVVTTKGCVDAWNPKVLRAAAGAHLRCPIVPMASWTMASSLLGHSSSAFVLHHLEDDDSQEPPADPVESEPMSYSAEYKKVLESQRCRAVATLAKKCSLLRSVKGNRGDDDGDDDLASDEAYNDPEVLEEAAKLDLNPLCYSETERGHLENQDVVLVIGGETSGVSREAHLFALQNRGQRVYVPLGNRMDSLNVVSVVSIVLFHFRGILRTKRSPGNKQLSF